MNWIQSMHCSLDCTHLFVCIDAWHPLKMIALPITDVSIFSWKFSFQSREKSRSVFCFSPRAHSDWSFAFSPPLLPCEESVDSVLNSNTRVSSFPSFMLYLSIYLSACIYIYIFAYEKKRREKTVDTMQTPYARARVSVCELTVAVFASDIEKMGCVCVCARNCATYLSFDLTCVCVCLYGHLDGTGLCLKERKKKKKRSDLLAQYRYKWTIADVWSWYHTLKA